MELEAALYPPKIRLDNSLRGYAYRVLQLPKDHPVSRIIPLITIDQELGLASSPIRDLKSTKETRPNQALWIKDSIKDLEDYNLLEPI